MKGGCTEDVKMFFSCLFFSSCSFDLPKKTKCRGFMTTFTEV